MQFGAVEACPLRAFGRAAEVAHDAADFGEFEGTGRDEGRGSVRRDRLALGPQCRRSHRQAVVVLQGVMRNAPDMPELGEDSSAPFMYGGGDAAPSRLLLGRMDARR